MRDIFKLSLRLLLFTLAAGLLLALTNAVTEGPIAEQAANNASAAQREVLSEANTFESLSLDAINDYPSIDAVYQGLADGQVVGYAFALSTTGYGGEIVMTLGIGISGNIEALAINSQSETVGLGARVTSEDYLAQYKGLRASADALEAGVDGITGATISSRAVSLHI